MQLKIIIALLVILAAGAGFVVLKNKNVVPTASSTTATSSDPDTLPPTSTPGDGVTTMTLSLGETGTVQGVSLTPHAPLNDSRCPSEVTCIWAGTVNVGVTIAGAAGTKEATMTPGTPFMYDSRTITLSGVSPYPTSGNGIAKSDYRFIFEVSK